MGSDSDGRVVIDRRIPLTWALGLVGAVALQAVLMYVKQDNFTEKMSELTGEVKAMRASTSGMTERQIEHTMILRDHERRLNEMTGHFDGRPKK